MLNDRVERIEIFTLWIGFANPPCHAAKLVIAREESRFVRERILTGPTDELPADLVLQLLTALSRPQVPQLDPALFDLPEPVLRGHYESAWSDDYPGHLVKIRFSSGRLITIRTKVQQAFMLPLRVSDSASLGESQTFDPRLSRAIAALMPADYPDRGRLAGLSGMLDWDLREHRRHVDAPESGPPDDGVEDEAFGPPSLLDDLALSAAEVLDSLKPAGPGDVAEEADNNEGASEIRLEGLSLDDLRLRLERGADPNIADEVGQTALMYATLPLRRRRFRLLVQAGADVEARRKDGYNGLHLACGGGEAETAEEWLRAGADVHARTPDGATPLMLAATWVEIVRLLLAAGADVNSRDQDGHTALVYSILQQSPSQSEARLEALRILIEAGADVSRPDRRGITPMGHARGVLARVQLVEEVSRAFAGDKGSSRGESRDDQRMAEAVVELITLAGGRE
jgi:hypothetical protein